MGEDMKYLLLKKTKKAGDYHLEREYETLSQAIGYQLQHQLVADTLVVRIIENWEVKERI